MLLDFWCLKISRAFLTLIRMSHSSRLHNNTIWTMQSKFEPVVTQSAYVASLLFCFLYDLERSCMISIIHTGRSFTWSSVPSGCISLTVALLISTPFFRRKKEGKFIVIWLTICSLRAILTKRYNFKHLYVDIWCIRSMLISFRWRIKIWIAPGC